MKNTMNRRPTARTWKLDRTKPLDETVREATRKVVEFYRPALEKLASEEVTQ